jgi:hypothetical protein
MTRIVRAFQGFKKAHHKAEDGLSKKHWDHADKKGHHKDWDHFDSHFEKHKGGGFEGKSHKVTFMLLIFMLFHAF